MHQVYRRVLAALGGAVIASWAVAGAQAAVQYRFVDLHVPGTQRTMAQGVSGGRATGYQFTYEQSAHALYWPVAGAPPIDLHPAGFDSSGAMGIAGDVQVGSGVATASRANHALVWRGAADRVTDLHPAGFLSSAAIGAGGGQQVGRASPSTTNQPTHAMLWTGSAASAVDLQPGDFYSTVAFATDGIQQVGFGKQTPGAQDHPLLWTGSAASAIDLFPVNTAYAFGQVRGVAGGRQVGFLYRNGTHAIVWEGSAENFVDLHPAGYDSSVINATNGHQHVGTGATPDGFAHVLLWDESGQFTDLNPFIPRNNDNLPMIGGIDAQGNIVGTIGLDGVPHAFMLVPVPEPGAAALLVFGSGFVALRRRRFASNRTN